MKFNDKKLKDPTGKEINWKEYYNRNYKLIKREEHRFFPLTKSGVNICTDNKNRIVEIKVWRDFGRDRHCEFKLDILEEYRKRKKAKKK